MNPGDLVEVTYPDAFYGAVGIVVRSSLDWRATVFVFFPQVGRERGYNSMDLKLVSNETR
jgi:hypothetical protein